MKIADYFIKKYLENRPMFMAIIRSQEAVLFQKYNKLIKGKILDFGCGDGFFAEHVFGKDKINVGLDLFSNDRIKEAISKKIYKTVKLYDGVTIPYSDNYFNIVVSNCVLEHIPNIKSSLKEIQRVLKPGGFFITSVMADQWEDNLFGSKIFGSIYLKYMRKTQVHHNLFSVEKWESYFKKAGFKIRSVDGYLNKKNSFYLDLFHYLSIGSLISYKLFNKWILFNSPLLNKLKTQFIKKIIANENKINHASALFFVLRK
ncbi:MAG: Methyltransferase type 11 [Candidatus Roizmanbacteria bacterium GW2011_GWA2_32_13]|uniref:Methyltransferase type 11 n=1 Tax=Candidatus Roizmanbacteria bacterium GW2011_GWA2_32_13 TaxID=1618475 RepID=A0A0G0BBP8_9BACT|nr:MAG: Methyltransferase type 11 [Candidatus Roizmanbacteria bacterium GW2011_GWA2_32_13]